MRYIPKTNPFLKVGFNARYLKELASWFEAFVDREPNAITLTFYSSEKPVLIEAENDGQIAKALLMPVRV